MATFSGRPLTTSNFRSSAQTNALLSHFYIRPVKFPALKNIAQKDTSVFSLSILVQRMKQFIWTKSSNGA